MDKLTLYYIILYLFTFLFGVCVGSFLNVCIYRLPKGESLTKSNSHCMTCGTPIRKRDLIPIISWCCLRGKCHACGAKISPRYTFVEALNGILWLLVFIHYEVTISPIYALLVSLMFSALIVVFFMDWDTMLINTYVVIFIGLLAIPEYFFCQLDSRLTLKSQIIGFFAASVPILIIALVSKEKAMGLGDAYLMAACGLFLGWKNVLCALLIALIIGSIAGLILKHLNGKSQFAFGPYLSVGAGIAVIWGNDIVDWYVRLVGWDRINEVEEMARSIASLF